MTKKPFKLKTVNVLPFFVISLSISINFINSLETEFIYLKRKRLQYDPKNNFIEIQKAFSKGNKIQLITKSTFFLINGFIFYFLPFWIIYFPISFFSNFGNWVDKKQVSVGKKTKFLSQVFEMIFGNRFFKRSVFISNYRIRARTLITTKGQKLKNRKVGIALFPFFLTFFFLLRSRLKEPFFSVFVKDALPGICLSPKNLSWDTFEEILFEPLVKGDDFNFKQKHGKLKNHNFIERLTISSNAILLEMIPFWEKQQKQFYIGFLRKKEASTLNNLPLFFDRNQQLLKNEIVHISKSPLQIKKSFVSLFGAPKKYAEGKTQNGYLSKKQNSYDAAYNFYARKQKFLHFYKDKIDLKYPFKPKIIDVFSKQQIQQKGCASMLAHLAAQGEDFDQIPLKNTLSLYATPWSWNPKNDRPVMIPTPNLFKTLQTFPNHRFTSDLLHLSSNSSSDEYESSSDEYGNSFDEYENQEYNSSFDEYGNSSEEYENGSDEYGSSYQENESDSEEYESSYQENESDSEEYESSYQENESGSEGYKSGYQEYKSGIEKKVFLEPPGHYDEIVDEIVETFETEDTRLIIEDLRDTYLHNQLKIRNFRKGYYLSPLLTTNTKTTFLLKPMSPQKDTGNEEIKNGEERTTFSNNYEAKACLRFELPKFAKLLTQKDTTDTPFENLQKDTNQFISLGPTYFLKSSKQNPSLCLFSLKKKSMVLYHLLSSTDLSEFVKKEESIDDQELDLFDCIKAQILDLEKNSISVNVAEKTKPDLLKVRSGFEYPDMKRINLRNSRIRTFYKKITFQKQNKEKLSMKIEFPTTKEMKATKAMKGVLLTNSFGGNIPFLEGNERNEFQPYQKNLHSRETRFDKRKDYKQGLASQLKINYLPTNHKFSNQNLSEFSNSNNIFQRVPTIYKKEINLSSKPLNLYQKILAFQIFDLNKVVPILNPTFSTEFRESWEGVTIAFWLGVPKLSFFYFAFKIFQKVILEQIKDLSIFDLLDDNLKEKLDLADNKKDPDFRIIKKAERGFKDVAGIDKIFPELCEMVWFLRGSRRSFKVGRIFPKGFLFVGPPGTGKTFLAQAIGGEAQVPVLIYSGTKTTNVTLDTLALSQRTVTEENKFTKLFEKARAVAPCIVFIDELDTMGESRQNILSNHVGSEDLIQSLQKSNQGPSLPDSFFSNKGIQGFVSRDYPVEGLTDKSDFVVRRGSQVKNLLDLLVELDGIKAQNRILVIGVTNRPKVLDPALTRPGRFDRVLNLEVPGKRARIEILKFYSQKIGLAISSTTIETKGTDFLFTPNIKQNEGAVRDDKIQAEILQEPSLPHKIKQRKRGYPFEMGYGEDSSHRSLSNTSNTNNVDCVFPSAGAPKRDTKPFFGDRDPAWEYLANLSLGFSRADLARAMNHSSIKAIFQNTGHTIETIEEGIEIISTYSTEEAEVKSTTEKAGLIQKKQEDLKSKDSDNIFGMAITRFAYYQCGKAVLHTLLPQHPDTIVLNLWPKPKNSRHINVNHHLTSINHRAKLETYLIGLYAGKAAELLFLSLNSQTEKQKTKKRTNIIKENKGPNRKIVSLLRNRSVIKFTNPNQILTKRLILRNKIKKDTRTFSDLLPSNITNIDIKQKNQKNPQVKDIKDTQKFFTPKETKKTRERKEMAYLSSQFNKTNHWHSTLGIEDLSAASHLAHSLVEKWHFYSNRIVIRRENQIFINKNIAEISERNVFDFFQQLTKKIENGIYVSNISAPDLGYRLQEWSNRPWWQNQILKETRNSNRSYDDWFRIYLPDPTESTLNCESVAPDKYYHNTDNLKNLLPRSSKLNILKERKKISKNKNKVFDRELTLNNLYKLDRDYIYHALILTCFNKAFSLLDENRELLDYFTDYLLRFEILRQHEIKQIFYDFGNFNDSLTNSPDCFFSNSVFVSKVEETHDFKKDQQKIKFIFDKNWGKNSRRSFSHFFSFDQ